MKRAMIVFLVVVISFSVAAFRIAYIINDEKIKTVALNQSKKSLSLGFLRGTIYDCKGERLTNIEKEYFACVPPAAKAINAVRKQLNSTQIKTLQSGFPIALKVDKNFKNDAIEVVAVPKRYGEIASHLIGYTNASGDGVSGIEKGYNSLLKGDEIKVSFDIDANSNVIANSQNAKLVSQKIKGIKLTIDGEIQSLCEQAISGKKGAVVVLDNKNGKIRALCSSPSFSQYSLADSLENESSPFLFRALSSYNCGSVFKLCVAACAIENGVSLEYDCIGKIKVENDTFSCINEHKNVDMSTALAVSCNCYFVRLSQKIGAEKLLQFAKSLGFGSSQKLCKGMVTSSGVLPDLEQLNSPSALANFSFGQGILLATPLQIASLIQTICNDGKYILPSLIEGECDQNGFLVRAQKQHLPTYIFSKSTSNLLCKYMQNVVRHGTGTNAYIKGTKIGGKTATAQTGIYNKDGKNIYQTWFGGFLQKGNESYTIVVMVEDGSSGARDCAPIFREIAKSILQL